MAIYLNVRLALARDTELYRSLNGVILTRGDAGGRILPSLFERVVDLTTGQLL